MKLELSSSMSKIIIPKQIGLNWSRDHSQMSFGIEGAMSYDGTANVLYKTYIDLWRTNEMLNSSFVEVLAQRNRLADQYNEIKQIKSIEDNIRRRRRFANQIDRRFHCPISRCNKGYGTEGSLTHHMRLKHHDYYESGEYQLFLEKYLQKLASEDEIKKVRGDIKMEGDGRHAEGKDTLPNRQTQYGANSRAEPMEVQP